MKHLSMDHTTLGKARQNLIHIGLIVWQKPLYQVLSLDIPATRSVMDKPISLGDILRQAMGGVR
jgi:hypothetical protein